MKVIINVDDNDVFDGSPIGHQLLVKGKSGRLYPATRFEDDEHLLDNVLERGREEGWSLAQRIITDHRFNSRNAVEIFGCKYLNDIFKMSYHEVLNKVQEWDAHHFEIGDVCILKNGRGDKTKVIVTNPCQDAAWVMNSSGIVECVDVCKLIKTGECWKEIRKIREMLKEEDE